MANEGDEETKVRLAEMGEEINVSVRDGSISEFFGPSLLLLCAPSRSIESYDRLGPVPATYDFPSFFYLNSCGVQASKKHFKLRF